MKISGDDSIRSQSSPEWHEAQLDVIKAPPASRLLVDAGPGTGKTAVACARVAYLIDEHGAEPSKVWLISFTRTAVREIRNRISHYVKNPADAFAVRIATLDSHAWALHSGFDSNAKLTGTHEQNIEEVLRLVLSDEQVREYIEQVEHLIVDEAQDVVGLRAELVDAIIRKLPRSVGVTVFADLAQSIYQFAAGDRDEQKIRQNASPPTFASESHPTYGFDYPEVESAQDRLSLNLPLASRLTADTSRGFSRRALTRVYRTDSPTLLTLFTKTREKVLAPSNDPLGKLEALKDEVSQLANGEVPRVEEQGLDGADDTLVLFRRRSEVLLASSFLHGQGIRHRLRMSGLPHCIHPWVAAALGECMETQLTRKRFAEHWALRVNSTSCETVSEKDAWALLVRFAGKSEVVVDMRRLRAVLGRSQPPTEFCTPEIGLHGPILGTIHASKGREADTVHLMMPGSRNDETDHDEESRIVFVGATRAKRRLLIGRGFGHLSSSLDSGRVWSLSTRNGTTRALIEIGRDGDVSPRTVADTSLFQSPHEVRTIQSTLRDLADATCVLRAESDRDAGFAYRLFREEDGVALGALTDRVNKDLFAVGKVVQAKAKGGKRRPPDRIRHINLIGVRTAVLPPDSPDARTLHDPWAVSGIVLVPIVQAYTTIFFPFQGSGRRK